MDTGFRGAVPEERVGWTSERTFLGISAFLFLACAEGTITWCRSMSGGMPMPGGWTMSMAWMRMPGQTRLGSAASFMGMWMVMMAALPALVHAQAPRLTQAQAIRIATRFSQAIRQPVTGTPTTVTYPAPPQLSGEQQPYWQPRWSIAFDGQAEFEVIDATGVIAMYSNDALAARLAHNPPTGKPLTAATAVQIATAALKAAGAVPELANTPSSSFARTTPGSTAGDEWDVIWQRHDPTSGILYPDQQLSVFLQGETGAIDMFGLYCPSPSPHSVAFTVPRTQATATAHSRLQSLGVQHLSLVSVQRRIVQPNTYWRPGGSWNPQPNVAGLAVWCCTFQDPNLVYYEVWVDAAVGTVAGGQKYSTRSRAGASKRFVIKRVAKHKI